MIYDIIVIGVGSMGSSACFHLAKRGVKVLGLEQFDITHDLGSHTGQSRLIRKAYMEHPDYVPLLHRAYDGWRKLEEQSGQQLYWETGIAYFGEPDDQNLIELKRAADLYNIRIEEYSSAKAREKWPQFEIPDSFVGILEPEAGFVIPERSIQVYTELAISMGATIKTRESVLGFREKGGVMEVESNAGKYSCRKLILTSGAFTADIVKLPVELKVTRQYLGWADMKKSKDFELEKIPCWMISEKETVGVYYGFPSLDSTNIGGPSGMKVGYHRAGEVYNAEIDDRTRMKKEEQILNGTLKTYFKSTGKVSEVMKCKYAYSPDDHFIIDHLPQYKDKVVVGAGFSGHGFKFIPVIGEALADLALDGKSDLPINFLGLGRFD